MAYQTYKALVCFLAAKALSESNPELYKLYGISNHSMHVIANTMDDCISYNTHKYTDTSVVNKFMGAPDGAGCFGFWAFNDGSKLCAMCSMPDSNIPNSSIDYYAMIYSKEENGPQYIRDMRVWPGKKEQLLEELK